ncbi:UTP--glucose-1-phosphate uridylyltransferase GalU [Cohaesibacter celericrescens]|uniref:UTP--glucose-1-phosphate uridylyltransferase n=1 Tax=Cohaesibacter celericrescens TaxID=2067669 RepID=A0A2N5XWZ0_9HYPH|nr:UTP--glucose-1-phosphate uridylyltransferase GalU [Cohaesibacter celericrescens]PLW79023.1 UTP--glucose-1-phosphate uridylyltransferase [Cohaesibacter celericrescens]
MARPIRKAVFPVAGLGTRFLPATKAMPKEMLTIVDRPVIQYVVDEARAAGVEHFIFVTGRNKGVIEDHFDIQVELEQTLEQRGKIDILEALRKDLPAPGHASFTRQQQPLGLGHAVLCAKELVGDEPFALLLPDMIMKSERGCLAEMMDVYQQRDGNVVALEQVPMNETHKYGVVETGKEWEGSHEILGMIEKPTPGQAPSDLILSGRYILQPEIFDYLALQPPGSGNEIQLTDAMIQLNNDQNFSGLQFKGETYDCGSKSGFLMANVAFGMLRDDIAPNVADTIRALLDSYDDRMGKNK